MDKNTVSRADLKHNFLKQIIIRADYRGVDEDEITKALPSIRAYLKDNGYIRYRTEVANEVDFHLEDPEEGTVPMPIPDNIRRTTVHVFQHAESGISVRLSPAFVLIAIESAKYKNCLTYCNNINEIIKSIQSNSDFFELVRFGIRKINQCILLDIQKLNYYFEKHLFKMYEGYPDIDRRKTFQSKECFSVVDKYDVNLICTVICGEANNGKPAYQVTFDSDIYVLEEHCNTFISDFSSETERMNNVLFDLYKDSITESFINALSESVFNDKNEILGVENND